MAESKFPTFGEAAESESNVEASIAEILASKVKMKYPEIPIHRPNRFLDSVERLAAPTKPSSIGPPKLTHSPLRSYLRTPRTRNLPGTVHQDTGSTTSASQVNMYYIQV